MPIVSMDKPEVLLDVIEPAKFKFVFNSVETEMTLWFVRPFSKTILSL